jgi:HSP20 family protein
MANIVKTSEQQQLAEQDLFRDPFRMMRDWLRFDPFRSMLPSFARFEREWTPSFEIRENGEQISIKGDVPGLKDTDLDVSLTGNRLQISGKREAEKETKGDNVYLYERSYGEFSRMFTLPEDIDTDHIRSELKDGVLTIVVPKKAAAKPKKIAVGGSAPKS